MKTIRKTYRTTVACMAVAVSGFINVAAQTAPLAAPTDGGSFSILDSGVSINGAPIVSGYNFASDLFGALHIQGKDSDHFFHVDINQPDAVSISGTGDILHFYHRSKQQPYSIYAAKFYLGTNAQPASAQKRSRAKKVNPLDLLESLHAVTPSAAQQRSPRRVAAGEEAAKLMPAYAISTDELKALCPSSVAEFEGETYVNYAALVPLLISSLQDIEATCDVQDQQIAALREKIAEVKALKKSAYIMALTPNPATDKIIVSFTANQASSVAIALSPVGGGATTTTVVNPAEESAEISLSSLPAGHYVVSLIVDGKTADTTRLIHN